MDLRDGIKLLLLLLLKALKRKRRHASNCRARAEAVINSTTNDLFLILRHALRRRWGLLNRGVKLVAGPGRCCGGGGGGVGGGGARLSKYYNSAGRTGTGGRQKKNPPKLNTLKTRSSATMSSRLRCKDSQLTPTLTAAAPRTKRGPQPFAKSAGRLRVRTGFCDTVIKAAEATTTKEEPSYTAKPGLDEGFTEYGPDPAAQPATNAILADSSHWPSGQYPPALHLRPPPPPPARPHQQQKQRRQQQQQQQLYSFPLHPRRQRHEDEEEEEQDGSQKRPHSPSSHEHGAQVYAQELQANKHVHHHHPRQSDQPPGSEVWEESRDDEQAGQAVMPTEAAAAAAAAGGSSGVRRSGSCGGVPRYKRPAHIDAEYRRRGKIQRGFELVQSLVPALQQTSVNAKQSKASMLTRSAEYIRELAETVECQKAEMEALQKEAEALQRDLQMYQQQLPSSGVNAVERPSCHTERMMEQYLQSSIAQDWKFWIFSFLVRPLSESFMTSVSLTTHQEFFRTLHEWSDRHLTLVNLRPIILTLLRSVSTTTSIITDPDKFPQEVHALANCSRKPSALTSHGGSDCCPSTRP